MLRQFKDALPPVRFDPAFQAMFETSPSLGFLSYLLRDETFGHGFYGDRPNPNDRLTTRDGFDAIRNVMIARFAATGIDTITGQSRATDMLYAWSQAGAREDVVQRVAEQSGDDAWLLLFLRKLYGPSSTLSLEGMSNFFDAPAAIVRRVYELLKAEPDNTDAQSIIRSLQANVRFEDGDFEEVLQAWEARESGKTDETGGEARP